MLSISDLHRLQDEIRNDPTGLGFLGEVSVDGIYNKLLFLPTRANPEPQGNVTIYNVTGTTIPVLTLTGFLNRIPYANLLSIKNNTTANIFYTRWIFGESNALTIDVSEAHVIEAINFCETQSLITTQIKDSLIGTVQQPDPNYISTVAGLSRSQVLFGMQITKSDVVTAMKL